MTDGIHVVPDLPEIPATAVEAGDATPYLDVIQSLVINGPQGVLKVARGSTLLAARAMPDGTIAILARRPIAQDTELVDVEVHVFNVGQPMPKDPNFYYLDTCMMQVGAPPKIALPGQPEQRGIQILMLSIFLFMPSLVAGGVKVVR